MTTRDHPQDIARQEHVEIESLRLDDQGRITMFGRNRSTLPHQNMMMMYLRREDIVRLRDQCNRILDAGKIR